MTKLLLAEDDETLGYLLKEYLQMNRFDVTLAKDGKEAMEKFQTLAFDVAIIDVVMPSKDGFTVLNEIKMIDASFPVLLVTSRGLKVDKLKGFRTGADDYIVKPVDEEELVARILAVLRRSGNKTIKDINAFEVGDYSFDFASQTLTYQSKITRLSLRECELLRELTVNAGKVVDSKRILKHLWGRNDYFARKSMDVFIYRLRTHLKKDARVQILNIHGKGYSLTVT